MTFALIDRKNAPENIGMSLRHSRSGPELNLVEDFLKSWEIEAPRGCGVTIFREPRIHSGFPDLVVVIWHMATAERWNPLRAELTKDDVRLMHYISQTGPCSLEDLKYISLPRLTDNLARLEAADMIRNVANRWIARSLSQAFAARHIIAIEAKVSQWREALDQALLNTWFASASFVLVPRILDDSPMIAKARNLGIGLWAPDDAVLDLRRLPSQNLPRSYTSWLFNEWAWRASAIGMPPPSRESRCKTT